MSLVRVHNMVRLARWLSAPVLTQSLEAPFGHAGHRLGAMVHRHPFISRHAGPSRAGAPASMTPSRGSWWAGAFGAEIMGARNKFGPQRGAVELMRSGRAGGARSRRSIPPGFRAHPSRPGPRSR